MDTRYPNLRLVSEAPVAPEKRRAFLDAIDEVHRRTGARCAYCTVSKRLHFYLRDPIQGVPFMEADWVLVHLPSNGGTLHPDSICRVILAGRMPTEEKDRRVAQSRADAEKAEQDEAVREMDSRRPEAERVLKRMGNRCGMGRHFRPSVVVDGTKFTERASGLLVAAGD